MDTLARTSRNMALFSDALQAGYQAATDAAFTPVTEPETVADPEVDIFAAAAALEAYYTANEGEKECARDKRRAKKVVAMLAGGVYGGWLLRWKPSTRETPDLEAIAETYRKLGLGKIPMKKCADSPEIERV